VNRLGCVAVAPCCALQPWIEPSPVYGGERVARPRRMHVHVRRRLNSIPVHIPAYVEVHEMMPPPSLSLSLPTFSSLRMITGASMLRLQAIRDTLVRSYPPPLPPE